MWQISGFTAFRNECILPKGIIEVIFNFSDSDCISALLQNKEYSLSRCFVNGFNTKAIQVQLPARQEFFGVRLQPLAVKKIFGAPGREFSNVTVDLTSLNPTFNTLWHRLAEEQSFNGRVALFCQWIEKRLHQWHPQEKLINHFLCTVHQHDLSVKDIANTLCYSPRQLARKMIEATGLNTEDVLLYKKYLHAVHLIHHSSLSLTEIAYQSHFSDQSHFIRTFKSYADITPGEYKRNKAFIPGHIYGNVR